MRMTYEKKIEEAKKQKIYLPDDLLQEEIVGVYGFFATKGNERLLCITRKNDINGWEWEILTEGEKYREIKGFRLIGKEFMSFLVVRKNGA